MKQLQLTVAQMSMLDAYGISKGLIGLKVLEYEKGELICVEGQPLTQLLIVAEGKAKVIIMAENGNSLLLCFYTVGGMIGDLELMTDNSTASTTIQALSNMKIIGIPLTLNRNLLKENTAFLNNAGRALAYKLNRCTRNCANIILYPLEARLCSYIEITNKNGHFQDKLIDVAELLGTSYRHLLRSLKKLCTDGILKKVERGYIVIDFLTLKKGGRGYYDLTESKV